jgi:mevalonate kinase
VRESVEVLIGAKTMRVGVPKEIKVDEYRVSMMPVGAELLVKAGHQVYIETQAGAASGFADDEYRAAGATILPTHEAVFKESDLIVKVKEPQPEEIHLFHSGQIVFTYFHFAASRELTSQCVQSGIVAIAYETIHDRNGRLPCLTPMSEIAGKMSIQEGAKYLEAGDVGRFGSLMRESHRSLRDLFEVSCRELDIMVEIAESLEGYCGGRMTGGGFGGCTVNLVKSADASRFAAQISERYQAATGIKPDVYVCSAANGASAD